ncbi:hypothetical protein [Sulfurospirillum sp. 1612]|uniref:hypothetical protein n=1 Tax=Sulfurospirillum sp. 1612 TaxID=3094835 RepID=UPI002F954909
MMRYSSLSILLNFILFIVLALGGVYCYKTQRKHEAKILELKQNFIEKTAIRFEDLPKRTQKRYLYIGAPSDFDVVSSDADDTNQTRHYIHELKKKLIIVQKDNLLLAEEKDKIQKSLLKTKTELMEQKKLLLSQSLEQMNEAEQQHYENISALRKRLTELERENIDLMQEENEKIIMLQNKIKSLERQRDGK